MWVCIAKTADNEWKKPDVFTDVSHYTTLLKQFEFKKQKKPKNRNSPFIAYLEVMSSCFLKWLVK